MNWKDIWGLLKETFSEWKEDRATRLAAALAYYTLFSIAPLLILAVSIAGYVFGQEAVQGEIVTRIQGVVGPEAADLIQTMIKNAYQGSSGAVASIISLVTLFIGASALFAHLQDSLNTVWEVKPAPGAGIMGMVKDRLLSFVMVLVVGFLLLLAMLAATAISTAGQFLGATLPIPEPVLHIISFIVSFGVLTLAFAVIYKYLPDVRITWEDVWVGAAITAFLITIGNLLIGLYLGYSGTASTYGAAGSLVAILVWVYYSAMLLLLGAEFTQVYARRYGQRIIPEEHAVRMTEEDRAEQGIPREEEVRERVREQPRKRILLKEELNRADRRVVTVKEEKKKGGIKGYIAAAAGLALGMLIGSSRRDERR